MSNDWKKSVVFGNYYTDFVGKTNVYPLNIEIVVANKKDNLSSSNNDLVDCLIKKKKLNTLYGKSFKINNININKNGDVFLEHKGSDLFFSADLFDIKFYVENNLVDYKELYSEVNLKNASEEIKILMYSINNLKMSNIVLNYYLKNEETFFELQSLINYNNETLYLSSDKENREKFLDYLKNTDEKAYLYITSNIKIKPQKKNKL